MFYFVITSNLKKIQGIGHELKNGEPHDERAPDYDDWSTVTDDKHKGLNGDILVWNPVVKTRHEISFNATKKKNKNKRKKLHMMKSAIY